MNYDIPCFFCSHSIGYHDNTPRLVGCTAKLSTWQKSGIEICPCLHYKADNLKYLEILEEEKNGTK